MILSTDSHTIGCSNKFRRLLSARCSPTVRATVLHINPSIKMQTAGGRGGRWFCTMPGARGVCELRTEFKQAQGVRPKNMGPAERPFGFCLCFCQPCLVIVCLPSFFRRRTPLGQSSEQCQLKALQPGCLKAIWQTQSGSIFDVPDAPKTAGRQCVRPLRDANKFRPDFLQVTSQPLPGQVEPTLGRQRWLNSRLQSHLRVRYRH